MTTILRMLALASLLFVYPMQAQANILLMPGEVIKGHAKEEETCEKCHKKFDKGAQPRLCMDCHKDIGKDVSGKRGYHGRLDAGKECRECHTEHKGRDAKIAGFDHGKFDHLLTDYPLKGAHLSEKVKCTGCHKAAKKYSEAPAICNECHKKDDKHKGNFGAKCESCHIEKDWKEILFDHDKKTKYSLLGKHKEAKCASCHKGDLYKDKLKTTCVSCHKKDDDKAHKGNFGAKCESCHIEKDWKDIPFDHDKQTKYLLLGKHKTAKCVSCHKGDLYKDKLPSSCFLCHEKDDKHKGQEGKKCETCHDEQSWTRTTFNHGKMSTFPLLGRHMLVDCKKCHAAVTFKDAKSDCWSCHEKDDVHKRKLGSECQTCHNTRNWKAWDFNHNKTSFKLDGAHKKVAGKCDACHQKPMAKKVLLSGTCGSCHDRDDVHNGNFGDRCERCHEGDTWKQVKMGAIATRKK